MTAHTFDKRRVGKTALEVTTLGMGGATLAGMMGNVVPPEQARAVTSAAIDAGIGYFDTAPHYGSGRSEHFMGDALRYRHDDRVISTKVGRLLRPVRSDAERLLDAFFGMKSARLAAMGVADAFDDPGVRAFFKDLFGN